MYISKINSNRFCGWMLISIINRYLYLSWTMNTEIIYSIQIINSQFEYSYSSYSQFMRYTEESESINFIVLHVHIWNYPNKQKKSLMEVSGYIWKNVFSNLKMIEGSDLNGIYVILSTKIYMRIDESMKNLNSQCKECRLWRWIRKVNKFKIQKDSLSWTYI